MNNFQQYRLVAGTCPDQTQKTASQRHHIPLVEIGLVHISRLPDIVMVSVVFWQADFINPL
jgi:hypothetical protein